MKLKSTLKALATALSPCVLSATALSLLMFGLCAAYAAEPLCWERMPNRPAPAQFDTFHGQSLDFRCTFTGFGSLPFGPGAISGSVASAPSLYYQTNGMGEAWWSLPATVSSNVLAATFPPSADPGAERLTVFFGAPSNAYAAAQVRFRNSPGANPNDLDPPSVLDWQAELATATNALWESSAAAFMPQSNAYTKSETDARIAELAPRTSLAPATNYTDEVAASKRGVKDLAVYVGYAPWNVPYFSEPAQWKPEIGYWEAADYEGGDFWYFRWRSGVWELYNAIYPDEDEPSRQPNDVSTNGEYSLSVHFPNYNITITRTSIYVTNGAHLVTSDDVAPTISNTVTKAYVENLGIESGVDAQTVTNIANAVVLDKRDLTDLSVYVYAPWHLYNDVKLEWNQDGVYGAGWYGNYGPDNYSLTFTNGVWRYNDAAAGICEVTNDFSVKILYFADYGYATRTSIYATNGLNIVTSDEIETLASTNYANTAAANAVDNADTTYRRTIGVTNLNQSVQYVNITDTTPTTLAITMPTDGATKDWMVYVVSVTNVTLSLPAATWWMADTAYTNDVPPATPTALWFSQVTDGIFILARQELTEVTP